MTIMKRPLFGLIITFLVLSCMIMPVFSLSLEDAKALAVENSSTLKDKALVYQKTMNSLGVSTFMPSLSLGASASFGTLDGRTNLIDVKDFTLKPSASVSAGISWSLSSSDFYGKSKDSLNAENAALTYKNAVESVKNSTESSYWNLVSLKYSVNRAEESLKEAEKTLLRSQELYEASRASELSYVQAQLSYSDSQLSLESAKSSYSLALADFCQSIGTEVPSDMQYEDLPSIENLKVSGQAASDLKDMLSQTSSVIMARNTRMISEITGNTTVLNARVPKVSLSTGLNYRMGLDNDVTNSITGSATLNVSVPLDSYLPGTQQNANVKNADIDIQRAELTYESTVSSLEDRIDDSLSAIRTLLASRGSLKSHMEYAQANLDLVSQAYENGYVSFADYEKAQSALSSARAQIDTNRFSVISRICTLAGILETDAASIIEILER